MCTLKKRLALTLFLPVLSLSLNTHADSRVLIHGGISVDTGNLRLYISDRQLSSHLYFDRYDGYDRRFDNRPSRDRSQRNYRYNQHRGFSPHYNRSQNHHYNRNYNPGYNSQPSGHRHSHRQIIIRDHGYSDYRKFRHRRSYHNW